MTRVFRTMLFSVGPADSNHFRFFSDLFAAVALLARYLRARRATRIDLSSLSANNEPLLPHSANGLDT